MKYYKFKLRLGSVFRKVVIRGEDKEHCRVLAERMVSKYREQVVTSQNVTKTFKRTDNETALMKVGADFLLVPGEFTELPKQVHNPKARI